MKSSFIVLDCLRNFIDALANANASYFYPSAIERKFGYTSDEYTIALELLIQEGLIKRNFVLFNPSNVNEKKVFYMYQEVSTLIDTVYEDFQFGEPFYVEANMIFVCYEITDEYKDYTQQRLEKKKQKELLVV